MAAQAPNRDKFPRKFGKYHLLGPLAQGGMGALYLAATGDRGLERLLVIKTVLPHLADAEYVSRFRDEAKVVVKLSHGNLIPVFDAGQVGGELFLTMDFVEGKDLRAVWNRCAKKAVAFPVDVAVFIAKELCRGLAYAHSYGNLELVHRDVSPPNVLVSYSGEVKLTDFGLAASTIKLEKTAPGIIYGKVAYMSPEQARGEKLDGRSDLYAAGIILWELLTGRQLFPPGSDQPQDLITRARNPEVLTPSKRAPRVSVALDEICVKALAADPEQRYANCEEFREALSGWLAAEAPGTDSARLEKFVSDLFREDIEVERAERAELMDRTRDRAATLPPTDELRRMVEEAATAGGEAIDYGNVRSPGSLGRRASDVAATESDRRRYEDRRRGPRIAADPGTAKGVAVNVPRAAASGQTVRTPPPTSAATALEAQVQPDNIHTGHAVDLAGKVIDGRYRIDELIGEGGMGKVYLAEHIDIGKRVAIKVLHLVYGSMPDLVERFRREARAASRIGHPHIVDVTDSGTTEDGAVYFVMEYLEGIELASAIDRQGALDVTRVFRIATQICRAVAAAHAVGIIHRDLKPENIFLTMRSGTSDFVKVLDFGIAKSSGAEEARDKRLTSPGMAMGTPEYMAPEQAAGRPADERCDIYSLGAILYEALTGCPPYEGENFMEILTKKATLDPPAPSTLRRDLPAPVEELVVRAMARDPDDRPPSMEAFEYELTKCLSGRGTAVAQILGMSSDPDLLASLNPGLNVVEERGLAHDERLSARIDRRDARLGESSDSLSAPTTSLATALTMSSDDLELSTDTVDIVRDLDSEPTAARRSSLGWLGWVAVLAVLGAGFAVLFYVASGERGKGGHVPAHAGIIDAARTPPPQPVPLDALPAKSLADADEAPVEDPPDAAPIPDRPRDPVVKKPRDKPRAVTDSTVPRSRAQAKKLLSEADAFKSRMKWEEARVLYERVAKSKHRRASGLLGLAKIAFETKDTNAAIDYAARALKAGAGDSARMVLGHAYYKKGRYAEALRYYDQVLKRSPGNKEAQSAANLARRKLGQ